MSFDEVTEKVPEKFSLPDFLDLDSLEEEPSFEGVTSIKKRQEVDVELELEDLQLDAMDDLADQDFSYGNWLRIVMLRTMVRTPALGKLKNRSGFNLTLVCNFLGFKNFEKYVRQRTVAELQHELGVILKKWESVHGTQAVFPKSLEKNLKELAAVVGLNNVEIQVLGFGVLLHAEHILEICTDLIGTDLVGYCIERILAPILNESSDEVRNALDRSSKLATSGLLSVDLSGRYCLRQLLDLLTTTFSSRMLIPQSNIRKIVEGFVKSISKSQLELADYQHIKQNVNLCKEVLASACANHAIGINILICGKPGTGKSEFARMIASEVGAELMAISPTNMVGAPISPIRRVRNYRIAQSFFQETQTVLLFDECEEVLNHSSNYERSSDDGTLPRKSWINNTLETNEIPTIWIANSIKNFDEAYIRRFTVCFEMPIPGELLRMKMIRKAFGGKINHETMTKIARSNHATPAIITQVADVISSIGDKTNPIECGEMAFQLINEKLKAQGKSELSDNGKPNMGDFNPEFVNSDTDLNKLCQSLVAARTGKICLYGVPGVGKTSFGKWIAKQMDVPHLVFKASDFLGPYVGETEQNITRAFQSAKLHGAVLQLDEVDSFLQDRSKASRQWELTLVNQMLLEIENFDGVLIASTNLLDSLDEASLRRFDLAIKLDFLKPDIALEMFEKVCVKLGFKGEDERMYARLRALTQLTPGDFEQVMRRAKLLPPESVEVLIESLEGACRLKKSGSSKAIGFLAKA